MIQVDADRDVPETLRVARTQALLGEALIDAQEAAEQLMLQRNWLTHRKGRLARGLPHYRSGETARLRLPTPLLWIGVIDTSPALSVGL